MSLWRLEWLRLVRTRRLFAILVVYLFFGFTGPLTARYLGQILDRVGTGGVRVEFPAPRPADGIAEFAGNAAQLGLLVVVAVASSALAFDARREMAVFLRTRVGGVRDIMLPAYAISTAAAVVGLLAGAAAAWYETVVVLGPLPPWRMLLGVVDGAVFLAFAVAVTAVVASLVRGALATAGTTLGMLLGMAVLGNLRPIGHWLPTTLLSSPAGLLRGGAPADYLPAAATAVVGGAVALAVAVALAARREL